MSEPPSDQKPQSAPPPPPQTEEWHVAAGGKTVGPASAERILKSLASGKIPRTATVWKEGMEGWSPISETAEFASAFVEQAAQDTASFDALSTAPNSPPPAAPAAPPPSPAAAAPQSAAQDPFDHGATMQSSAASESSPPVAAAPSSSSPLHTQAVPADKPSEGVRLEIGAVLDDKYLVTLRLGEGGMGAVYRVIDKATHVESAVKVLSPALTNSPQALEGLRHEVSRALPLNHQNLLNIKQFADSGPVKYVVMENIDGEDLEEFRLRKGGRVPDADFQKIVPQLLVGLEFLHERGVVHLDIKPQNVMVAKTGEVKITDYGISKTIKEQLSDSREVSGTLCFMAPEQLREGQVCDRRTDVYAVGMTLLLLRTGRFPFSLESAEQIVQWHIDERHAMEDLGDAALTRVVRKALSVDPNERWSSCQEMLGALQQSRILRGSAPVSGSASAATPATAPTADDPLKQLVGLARRCSAQPKIPYSEVNTFGRALKKSDGSYESYGSGLKGTVSAFKSLAGADTVELPSEIALLLDEQRIRGVTPDGQLRTELADLVERAQRDVDGDPLADKYRWIKIGCFVATPFTLFATLYVWLFVFWPKEKKYKFQSQILEQLGAYREDSGNAKV